MYSILFSMLLASTYVSAIPLPLGARFEYQPDNEAERTNYAAFTTSLTEANRQIGNMQEVLKKPNDPRIKTAFGPNANHAEISKVVNTLATKNLKVQSLDSNMADSQMNRVVNAFVPITNGVPQSARFGSTFFGLNTKQQAGTIIHEATHQLAGTGDHVDHTAKRIIPASESAPAHAEIRGGYADTMDPTASTLGSKYENMRDTVSNTHQNADSYRVFAALCSRSLYKRALLKDDPVGYYLSKRSQCNLPPDYFAKKAAAKAAAAKGTTTSTKKGTTSPAAANRKASTAKSTGVKGTKDLKGASTKATKELKTVRKGTSTRKSTGSTAGKGLKTVKSTKDTKGVKTAKGAKTAMGLTTTKTAKGTSTRKATGATAGKGLKTVKSTKDAKGVKTEKGAKTTKEVKTTKAGKGLKPAKESKAVKGVKAVKGANTVQATKAAGGVKVTKGVNVAKGAKSVKGTESRKSVNAVKAINSPKSTAARKTASVAKTATKVATKAASNASVKVAAPKAAVKVTAAGSKKGKNLRRDLGMTLDELD